MIFPFFPFPTIFPFLPKLITPAPITAPQLMPHRMPPMLTPVASSTKSDSYCYRDANSSHAATSNAAQIRLQPPPSSPLALICKSHNNIPI
ncbi:uncharacterized protein E5676_scaffold121G00060 [Cucumis melo var. makuwa]|uniref:Uncharacterized protein n=1 Tax=Cucumis melo var. makuwa TaxID=1194695 RepID=A0A5D3BWD1_CUCMM|nr:uncharacterized protein E6C27_scaffold269G00940 [Cucumis melo var. makuwa]TYK03410.1 uncharacterized protein E5676_scaffold121G00060 [Cucumis melo var. makuwa]